MNSYKYHLNYSEQKTDREGDEDHEEGQEGDQAGTYTWAICHMACGKN